LYLESRFSGAGENKKKSFRVSGNPLALKAIWESPTRNKWMLKFGQTKKRKWNAQRTFGGFPKPGLRRKTGDYRKDGAMADLRNNWKKRI